MKHKTIVIQLIFLIAFSSCNRQKIIIPQARVNDLPEITVKIHRYGKTLFQLDTANFKKGLKNIHDEYRFFLGDDLDNEKNIRQLLDYVSDTQIISIYHKTMQVFPDIKPLENTLGDAFSRFRYFFPDHKLPVVYTYISDIYYESPVMKKDTVVVIALDDYLGSGFPVYRELGLPRYHTRCMRPDNIATDVMKVLYDDDLSPHRKQKTLLDRMTEAGKLMVYLDAVLPDTPDSLKICYSEKQMAWAKNHEKEIWGFMVENKLLYSTDYQMISKLMQDGPFTKGFGNDSPSRLGIFVGWQILRQYMINNPEITFEQMIGLNDSQTILEKSHYKP